MNIFTLVKATVTTKQAAEFYGLKVTKNSMVCCPFHQDQHPSMKVDDRYYCFGCHETGDVINFTAGLFHCSQYEAAKKLASDFHIDITEDDHPGQKGKKEKKPFTPFKPDLAGLSAQLESIKAEAAQQEFEVWIKHAADVLTDYRLLLSKWIAQYAPQAEDEEWHPRFVEASAQIEIVDYWFSMIDDPLEQHYFYENYQGEVKRIHDRIVEYQSETGNADCT